MKIQGKVAVVTGAAGGIGLAVARRFLAEGARGVVMADVQPELLAESAKSIGGLAAPCDVTSEAQVKTLIALAEERFGQVDIYFSNAGVSRAGTEAAPDAEWTLNWNLHVMAHVYAARDLIPKMVARGEGYFVVTSSAAGLLSHIDSATYAVTKHGTVAFGEYLAIQYGGAGVRVSALCPQQVATPMTRGMESTVSSVDGILSVEELADCVVRTMDREEFLILPHPKVLDYMRRKTADYDGWLSSMRRLKARFPRR